ncbi:hypothetical protein ANCCAN_21758, partial [Ancylostoma caninum]
SERRSDFNNQQLQQWEGRSNENLCSIAKCSHINAQWARCQYCSRAEARESMKLDLRSLFFLTGFLQKRTIHP